MRKCQKGEIKIVDTKAIETKELVRFSRHKRIKYIEGERIDRV